MKITTDRRQLLFMLLPFALGLTVLVVVPFAVTVVMSLADYDLIEAPRWIGLGNFTELFGDEIFRTALVNSLVFAAIAVPLRLLLALGFALLLHRRAFLVGTARTMAALPVAVPEIAFGLLWLWLFNPLYGPVNKFLQLGGENGLTIFGRTPPQWLTDPTDARAAIIVMSLFTIGEMFVLLLATRLSLPQEVYELAALEDATGWDIFRRITLPLMAPVLGLLLLRDTILSFQFSFVPALVVTEGGPPPYSTTYVALFTYRNAFEYLRYGYAAAASVLVLLLTIAIVLVQWRLFAAAKMYDSAAAKMYDSAAAKMYDSTAAKMYDSTAAKMYDSTAAKMYDSTAAQRNSSPSVVRITRTTEGR